MAERTFDSQVWAQGIQARASENAIQTEFAAGDRERQAVRDIGAARERQMAREERAEGRQIQQQQFDQSMQQRQQEFERTAGQEDRRADMAEQREERMASHQDFIQTNTSRQMALSELQAERAAKEFEANSRIRDLRTQVLQSEVEQLQAVDAKTMSAMQVELQMMEIETRKAQLETLKRQNAVAQGAALSGQAQLQWARQNARTFSGDDGQYGPDRPGGDEAALAAARSKRVGVMAKNLMDMGDKFAVSYNTPMQMEAYRLAIGLQSGSITPEQAQASLEAKMAHQAQMDNAPKAQTKEEIEQAILGMPPEAKKVYDAIPPQGHQIMPHRLLDKMSRWLSEPSIRDAITATFRSRAASTPGASMSQGKVDRGIETFVQGLNPNDPRHSIIMEVMLGENGPFTSSEQREIMQMMAANQAAMDARVKGSFWGAGKQPGMSSGLVDF